MLRSGSHFRFTAAEVEQARRLGICLDDVRTEADFARAMVAWVEAIAPHCPDLLQKIAAEAARRGRLKLPARLTLVAEPAPGE
jgi:hypothetical protein